MVDRIAGQERHARMPGGLGRGAAGLDILGLPVVAVGQPPEFLLHPLPGLPEPGAADGLVGRLGGWVDRAQLVFFVATLAPGNALDAARPEHAGVLEQSLDIGRVWPVSRHPVHVPPSCTIRSPRGLEAYSIAAGSYSASVATRRAFCSAVRTVIRRWPGSSGSWA